jgi:hypothetical protein
MSVVYDEAMIKEVCELFGENSTEGWFATSHNPLLVDELEKRSTRVWKADQILSTLKVDADSLFNEDELLTSVAQLIEEANRAKAAARLAARATILVRRNVGDIRYPKY